ncbi:hypothetical protein EHQ68_16800 [Leptospira congkakensis]|uniref:Uncharacterized protein n=1 Tax=Leptospira congkakensis TaxID=2484932 RepID=A0A4Z1AET2_9LEPT|nr:hypothetical protein [Leptospira congkakensis]TGL85597.1 hypothetical protein EHQ68_16800 [Leptospira congkakensis]TGL92356.1 hypothetical protein EHQ69_08090 [Leptospira congkakensis]TGL99976.1 hypothetical protein EHQ70_00045 [Leptospira congkakensis]
MELANYRKQPLFWNGMVMAALTVTIIPLLFLDSRTLLGTNVWIKPLKFTLSVGLYSLTTVWVMFTFLKDWKHQHKIQMVLTITSGIEIVLITLQAARGESSHFNITTTWNQIVFSVMGTSISIFWVFHLWMGYQIFRTDSIFKSVKESLVWGLGIAGFAMIIAFFMTSPRPEQMESMKQGIFQTSGSHSFGVGDPGKGITFFGWSTKLGDMRVPHFFGMHVMQVFVFLAAYLMKKRNSIQNLLLVRFTGIVFLLMNVVMVIQTLNGESIFNLNPVYTSIYGISMFFIFISFFKLTAQPKEFSQEVTV